jgi:DNA-binding response OmpR family regulator
MPTAPKTVLIADDDEDILNLVRFRLERDGLRVLLARDGQQALQTARQEGPDLCVLDVMMPKLSGLEVLAQLRRDPDTAAMPVILLTARAHEADVDTGFDGGANDYVIKPFSPQELRQRVRAQLNR